LLTAKNQQLVFFILWSQGRTQGGWDLPGCTPQTPKTEIQKIHFVDIMILKVLRNFPFSRNQPLKSADA
jgi:hypothetical protein